MGDEQLAFGPVVGNWGAGDIHMVQISRDRAFAQKADAKTGCNHLTQRSKTHHANVRVHVEFQFGCGL